MNVKELIQACKDVGIKGYSGLRKAELVKLLATRVKPAAEKGSTRDLRETASTMKKQGLITGAVSTLKIGELKTIIAAGGGTVVKKPAGENTIPWLKEALMPMRERVNAYAKAQFGRTISACRKDELVKLYERFVLAQNVAA